MNDLPGLGIDMPDVIRAGPPSTVLVVNAADPSGVELLVHDAETGKLVSRPSLRRSGPGSLAAEVVIGRPGVYRLSARLAGASPVTRLFLAVDDIEPT